MSEAGFPQAPIVDIGALYDADRDAYARAQRTLVEAVTSSGVFVAVIIDAHSPASGCGKPCGGRTDAPAGPCDQNGSH